MRFQFYSHMHNWLYGKKFINFYILYLCMLAFTSSSCSIVFIPHRTEARYGPHGHTVGPTNESINSPMYASLDRSYSRSNGMRGNLPPPPEEPIHLVTRRSASRDHLISPESADGVRIMNTDIDYPAYITEGVGVPFVASTTNPSTRGVPMSATNPIPDYEQLDHSYKGYPSNRQVPRKTSCGENSLARKFSSGGVSPTSPLSSLPGSPPKSVFNSSHPRSPTNPCPSGYASSSSMRNFSRSSSNTQTASSNSSTNPHPSVGKSSVIEEMSHQSDCSEEPPPYTSRPSSTSVPPSLTPYPSMLDNSAYNDIAVASPTPVVEQEDENQWYLTNNSDMSLNTGIHPTANSRAQIAPYAMVHNSDIPYTVPTEQLPAEPVGRRGPLFQISNRKRTPQPYSEPIRSSTGSITTQGSFTDTKEGMNFQTVVV